MSYKVLIKDFSLSSKRVKIIIIPIEVNLIEGLPLNSMLS